MPGSSAPSPMHLLIMRLHCLNIKKTVSPALCTDAVGADGELGGVSRPQRQLLQPVKDVMMTEVSVMSVMSRRLLLLE